MKSRGFTMVELAFVIGVIGLLVALTVPAFMGSVKRTQIAEAQIALEEIASAQLAYRRDHGVFLACAPSSAAIPSGAAVRFDESAAGWREIGYSVEGPVRYRYRVELEGDSFNAIAEGDIDGDGASSMFTLHGSRLTIETKDAFE